MKIIAQPRVYWKSKWNVFDFLIVVGSVGGIVVDYATSLRIGPLVGGPAMYPTWYPACIPSSRTHRHPCTPLPPGDPCPLCAQPCPHHLTLVYRACHVAPGFLWSAHAVPPPSLPQ